jgi:hypothetical protein
MSGLSVEQVESLRSILWQLAAPDNEFTARMFEAINLMVLNMPPGREWRGDLRLRPIEGRLPPKSERFIKKDTLKQRDEMRIMPALVGQERFRPASATRRPDR